MINESQNKIRNKRDNNPMTYTITDENSLQDSGIRNKRNKSPYTYTITDENSKIERTCSSCSCHSKEKNRDSQKCSVNNSSRSQTKPGNDQIENNPSKNLIEIKEDYAVNNNVHPVYGNSDPQRTSQQYMKTLQQNQIPESNSNKNFSNQNLMESNYNKRILPTQDKGSLNFSEQEIYSSPQSKIHNISIPQEQEKQSEYVPTYNYIEDLKNLNIDIPDNSLKSPNYFSSTINTDENNSDDILKYYPHLNKTLSNQSNNLYIDQPYQIEPNLQKQNYMNKFCPNRNLYKPSSLQNIQNRMPYSYSSNNFLSPNFLIPKVKHQNSYQTINGNSTIPTESSQNLKHINNILGNKLMAKLAEKKMNNYNSRFAQYQRNPNTINNYGNNEYSLPSDRQNEENSKLNFDYKDLNRKKRDIQQNNPDMDYSNDEKNNTGEEEDLNNEIEEFVPAQRKRRRIVNKSNPKREKEEFNEEENNEDSKSPERKVLRGKAKRRHFGEKIEADEPIGKDELQQMAEKYNKLDDVNNIEKIKDIDNFIKEGDNLLTNESLANNLRNRKMKDDFQDQNDDSQGEEVSPNEPKTKEELKQFNEYLKDENDSVKKMNFIYKHLLDSTFYFLNSLSSKHKFNGNKKNDIFQIQNFMKNPDDLTNLLIELEKCTAGEQFIKPQKLLRKMNKNKKGEIEKIGEEEFSDDDELQEIHEEDFTIEREPYNENDIPNPNHPINLAGKDEDLTQIKENFSFGQNSLAKKNKDYKSEKPNCVACLLGCGNSVRGYSPMNYNPYQKYPKYGNLETDPNKEEAMKKQKSSKSMKSNSSSEQGKRRKRKL